ncbi:hypothetical protein [Micromonospora sp. WMMD987]|uniref:hypothetical protein n=1 Tax=Micromonospora sp. WMMD987 TaxID=3016089 RepID=UPI00249B5B40|nr:hypothetical protein [Micromonospora sp. WMMD987]WFE95808.1 hypothetical protein O7612_02425 [Micromonospora sp. WMMD987]
MPGTASAAPVSAPLQKTAALDDVTGAYYPVAPARLLDTRSGVGAPAGKIGAGKKVDLQVAGRGGVPASGVGAVVLNVTVTGPTAASFLTAYPTGESRPTASSVNFAKDWLGSNNVTVKLGAGGQVSVFNNSGSTDVIVDVVGFYAGDDTLTNRNGGQYEWYLPERLWDTRQDPEGKPPAGQVLEYSLDFGDDYNTHVKSLVFNLTAVSPAKSGFLTAWSGAGARPTASTVNYLAGKNVPNLSFVQTTPCTGTEQYNWCTPGAPKFKIYTSQASHVLTDLVGVVDDGESPYGMRFAPLSPTRIVDSRSNLGISGAIPAGGVRKVTAPDALVTPDTEVLAMNVTAVTPTNNTVVTTWPADFDGIGKPDTSNLNPYAGQVVSNGVLGVIGPNNAFNVHNLSGSTHLVADVVGTFYYPAPAAAKTAQAKTAKSDAVPSANRR